MSSLKFENLGWIATTHGDEEQRATTASLRIVAGDDRGVEITKVEDRIGQTVRPYINVPLASLANWLLMNWWRLRWEGKPINPNVEWSLAHRVSGIGGDHAWPALEIYSDGDFVHFEMEAEPVADACAVRYLQPVSLDVRAEEFETTVEKFLDHVQTRLASTLPDYRDLVELREELAEERRRERVARNCRWQALAGIHPGDASDEWLSSAESLVEEVGIRAGDELMSTLPQFAHDLASAKGAVEEMKLSSTSVDLSCAIHDTTVSGGLPWQRGVELAHQMRTRHRIGRGPLSDEVLSDLLKTSLPLPGPVSRQPLGGGMRNGSDGGRTRIVKKSRRIASQRFYLARMIGAAHALTPDQHLVPVTDTSTSLQKLERAFAQEFLCPWMELEQFTVEHGVDDEALIDAADHFGVSEWLVRSTLVNRGRVPRDLLPSA